MTRHAYPTPALLGDYARAAVGLVPMAAILTTMSVGIIAATVLGGFAALFAAFAIRTALRHGTQIEATEAALTASGLRRVSISWSELDRMKLAYYSTRRDRRGGWLQLELRAGPSTLRLDSRIEGFADLVSRSASAAKVRGLTLNAATSANLAALGVCLHTEPGARDAAGAPT